MTELAMIPDPNPADYEHVSDSRDPRKLPAADQMCWKDKDNDLSPALYNFDKCNQGTSSSTEKPEPQEPVDEDKPKSQKAGVDLDNSVSKINK